MFGSFRSESAIVQAQNPHRISVHLALAILALYLIKNAATKMSPARKALIGVIQKERYASNEAAITGMLIKTLNMVWEKRVLENTPKSVP